MVALEDHQLEQSPRDPSPVEHDLTEYELFRKHCVDHNWNLEGDMWVDVPGLSVD